MNTTPALELAELLHALATHLQAHPHLPPIEVDRSVLGLQIASYPHRGEPVDAHAVLLWAQTMADPVIELREHDGRGTTVGVTGTIRPARRVHVWDVDRNTLYQRRTGWGITRISLAELAAYVDQQHPDTEPTGRDGGAR